MAMLLTVFAFLLGIAVALGAEHFFLRPEPVVQVVVPPAEAPASTESEHTANQRRS